MGLNLFNFSYKHSLPEMRNLVGANITLLGNIPPRDVLSIGSEQDVAKAVENDWNSIENKQRIIWSCGGGMPQGVSTHNLTAFSKTVNQLYDKLQD